MNLSKEANIYTNHVQRFLGNRANIQAGVNLVRQNPEIAEQALMGLDFSIGALNRFFTAPEEITNSQGLLLPFSYIAKQTITKDAYYPGEKRISVFPQSTQLLALKTRFDIDHLKDTFNSANHLMETGELTKGRDGWGFHREVTDFGQLADSLALEIYGEFIARNVTPFWNKRQTVLLALEEMLAVHGQDSRMFQSVSQWYTTEEGFSPLLVGMVQGKVDLPFVPDRVLRATPNYMVFEGFKPGFEGKEQGQRLYIEPTTDQGQFMLDDAAKLHRIDQSLTPAIDVLSRHTKRPALRTDRIAENLRPLLGGFTEIPKPGQDTVPSPDRMEECLRSHPSYYSFTD